MIRRRALGLLGVALAIAATAAGAAGAQLATHPLMPLSRGQLLVSLGDPPDWLPESGTPETLTLFAGRPALRHTAGINAYIAVQRAGSRCAPTAHRGHAHLVLPDLYARGNQLTRTSPFTPGGGAERGDDAASLSGVVVHQARVARFCIWLARSPTERGPVARQDVPLLNGLFAASVSAIPSASKSAGGRYYTMNAIAVGRSLVYGASTSTCGGVSDDGPRTTAAGELATESISYGSNPCAGDGSTFSFTTAAGRSLGSLSYPVADALTAPPLVASRGGCELDALTVVPLAAAQSYLPAVGCRVGRLLLSPLSRAEPRGAVLEAQVDGGVASVAPRGTAVDLVLNGRPPV